MAKAKAKKQPKRLSRPATPKGIERSYSKSMRSIATACAAVLRRASARFVVELKRRDDSVVREDAAAAVNRALAGVKVQLDTIVKKAKPGLLAQGVGKKTKAFAVRAADNVIRGVVAIPKSEVVSNVDLRRFVKENVALIKSIPTYMHRAVEQEMIEAWSIGRDPSVMSARIEESFGVAGRRADLIAADQLGSLNGKVQASRCVDLGFKFFRWSTSRDERVRPEHEDREGVVYEYSDPPDGELPGTPIRCRCVAIPIPDEEPPE